MHDIRSKRSAVRSGSRRLKHAITIRSFGVDILFRTNSKKILDAVPKTMDAALAGIYTLGERSDTENSLDVEVVGGQRIDIYREGELKYVENDLVTALSRIESSVRLTVAEHAVGKVFIHSGAAAWKGKGVIFPARSFKGKSTLTAALVRSGARYFSDEYAVIDANGRLHPFPKALSLREQPANPYEQVDHHVSSLGGTAGKRPVPVKLILLTEFKAGAKWRPKHVSEGQAVLGVLNNSVGIRRDPGFILPVITKMCRSASAITSTRGDANETAGRIIEILEEIG